MKIPTSWLTVQATVFNLGPVASHGGNVTYRAQGDVTLAELATSCVEVSTGAADVAVSCDLAPLDVGTSDEALAPFRIVPQSMGDVTVTASVTVAGGDVDGNADNDAVQKVVSIGEAVGADLEMTGMSIRKYNDPTQIIDDPSEYRVGARLDFTAEIRNNGPYASGEGTLVYHALGDVQVEILTSACAEILTIYDVSISCDFAGVLPGAEALVLPFHLVPQSVGELTVWATVSQGPAGNVDPDPNNNEQSLSVDVLQGQLDLAPYRFALFGGNPVAGGLMQLASNVSWFGPDLPIGATLTFRFNGLVNLSSLGLGCTEVSDPAAYLAVECAVGSTGAFSVTVSPLLEGPLEVSATTAPGEGQTDVNTDNDVATLVIPIQPPLSSGN